MEGRPHPAEGGRTKLDRTYVRFETPMEGAAARQFILSVETLFPEERTSETLEESAAPDFRKAFVGGA